MKLPRDVSGRDLARRLRTFGYEVERQRGSHIRLASHSGGSTHSITIPDHDELRVGTLRAIVGAVAERFELSIDDCVERLFAR